MHYVIAWLADYFRYLYSGWDDTDGSHQMRKIAGILVEKRSFHVARSTFKGEDYVRRHSFSFHEREDITYLDDESLFDVIF